MYAKHDIFSDPRPPPSSCPPTWLLGLDPPEKNMCFQNDQCHEGVIWRYVCWGTRDPRLVAPQAPHGHPPRTHTGPKKVWGGWGQGLSLSTPHGAHLLLGLAEL